MKTKDILNMRFGRLVVKEKAGMKGKNSVWLCLCDCGNEKVVFRNNLIRGLTISCGCAFLEIVTKHGEASYNRTETYSSWANMMTRAGWFSDSREKCVKNYKDSGIGVCKRWHDFKNFKSDMGERPKGMSIDRIDNSKGYSPDNCRWATKKEQCRNTRRTRYVKHNGNVIPAISLSENLGLSYGAVKSRANRRGNDFVKAFASYGVTVENA